MSKISVNLSPVTMYMDFRRELGVVRGSVSRVLTSGRRL